MHSEILTSFARPIAALAFAGVTYLAEATVIGIEGLPGWISSLGLPVAFLIAVIYALIAIHKALRESEKGRRDDWGQYAQKLEVLLVGAEKSRAELILATNNQTREIENLAEHMKARPCQK